MKKYQLGSSTDPYENAAQLSTETPALDSINISEPVAEEAPDAEEESLSKLKFPEKAEPLQKEEVLGDEETQKFIDRMSAIAQISSGLSVQPEIIKAPGGFGESKYDKYANSQADLDDLNEIRARHQSSLDITGNLLGRFIGGTGLNVAGSVSMLAYGLPKGIHSALTGKEIDPETGFETEAGQRFLNDFMRNDVVETLDGWQEDLQESLPIYYTRAEQEKSLMNSPFKFWADNVVNGATFLTGALLTEIGFGAAGATVGTALGLETGPGALVTGAAGAAAGTVAGLTRVRKLYRMLGSPFSSSARLARNLTGKGTIGQELSIGKKIAQGTWDVSTVGRQLITGSAHESALEARMTHDEMLQTILDGKYGDRIAIKEKELGRGLETLEKIELLTPEERLSVDNVVTNVANSVFGANMLLVGMSNVFMLGNRFQPRILKRMSVPRYNPLDKVLMSAKVGEKGIKRTNAILKWGMKGAYEGFIEEGGQGTLNKAAVDYATMTALGDTGLVEALGSYNNSLARGFDDTYYTKEGQAEVATGILIGLMGLPKFIGGPGMLASAEFVNEESRHERLKNFAKYENDILETVKKIKKENPGILHETASSLAALSLINARSETYQAALKSGNKKLAKDIETSNLIDYVLYKHDTGRTDELDEMSKTIEQMPAEDFKKMFGYDDSMTDTQILERKAEITQNTSDAVARVKKAADMVDNAVGFNTDEKYNEVLKQGSIGNVRRSLVHYTANIELSDKREKDMIAELASLTGGKITEVNDQVDSITFELPDGSFKTIRVGELNVGSTVKQQKAETRKRAKEIMASDLSRDQKNAELGDLEDYLNFLEDLPDNDMLMPNMFEMGPEEGSQLEEQMAEWLSSDPQSAVKEEDVYTLMDDIRKLRADRIAYGETLRRLKDPRLRSALYQEVNEKVKAHKDEVKKRKEAKKATDPQGKKNATKNEAEEKRKAFKEKLRSFKSTLQEELSSLNESVSKVAEEAEAYASELTTLEKLEKRANKNKTGTASSSEYRGGVKLTVDELRDKIEEVKTFLSEARDKEAKFQESIPERKREIEILLEALKEVEDAKFDAAKFDPTLTDIHQAVLDYAQMKGVSEVEAGVLVKNEAQEEIKSLDSEIVALSEKLEKLTGLASILENLADSLEGIPEGVLQEFSENRFAKNILEQYPDIDIKNLEAQIAELNKYFKELGSKKEVLKEVQERGKEVARSFIFKDVLAHQVKEKEKSKDEYDLFHQDVKMYETVKEENMFKQDISERANKTAGLQGSYSLELGQIETGATETFIRLTKESMSRKLNDIEEIELKQAESQLVFFHALNNMEFPNQDGILQSFYNKKTRTLTGKQLVYVHSGTKLPAELKDLEGMFKDDPAKGNDGKDIKAVIATVSKDEKTGKWKTTFDRYQGRLIYTSIFLPQEVSDKGYERYTNKRNLSKAERTAILESHRKFRKEVLDQDDTLHASQIQGKSQGSVLMMKPLELQENGGRLNFADESVFGNSYPIKNGKRIRIQQQPKDTLIMVSKAVQTNDGKYRLETLNPGDMMKGYNAAGQKGIPSITLPPGKAMTYDAVSHVNVPMTPTLISRSRAKNLARLYTFALKKHQMLIEEGNSAKDAADKVFATDLQHGGQTIKLSKFLSDQIHATDTSEEGFNLRLRLNGNRFELMYGQGDVLHAEDMDNPAKVEDLVEFISTNKYHNVNSRSLQGTIEQATSSVTKGGKQVVRYHKGFQAVADKKWVDIVVSDEIMDENGNIKIARSTIYNNYNEYLLKRRTPKAGEAEAETLAPLMTKARNRKSSTLILDKGPEVALATASNMRTEGGNLRFSYDLIPVKNIVRAKAKTAADTEEEGFSDDDTYTPKEQKDPSMKFEDLKDLEKMAQDQETSLEKELEESTGSLADIAAEVQEKKEAELIASGTHVRVERSLLGKKVVVVIPRNEVLPEDVVVEDVQSPVSDKKAEKPVINIYWGSSESSTNTRVLSNLAPRKFTYQGKEYGSVEHAYQTLKSGSFDQATYGKYVKAGGYGTKIRGKSVQKGFDNLKLMKDLVVESFKQNPEQAKLLLNYSDFTHTTNQVIDKAFLDGVRLAQKNAELAALDKTPESPQQKVDFEESAAIINEYSNSEIATIIRNSNNEAEDYLGRFISKTEKDVEGGRAVQEVYEAGTIQRLFANDGSKIQRLIDNSGKVRGIPLINLTMDAKEAGLLFDGKKDFSLTEKEITDFFNSKFSNSKTLKNKFEEDDDLVFMRSSVLKAKDMHREMSEKKMLAEVENALRMQPLDVAISQTLLNSMDGTAVAALTDYGKVILSTLAPSGAIYHEAFHNVSLYLLSPKDAGILYRKVRQIPGETITYKGEKKQMSELTDKEAEEWLAEEFREYVLSDGEYVIGKDSVEDTRSILKKFFDAVSAIIRRLLKLNESFEYDPKIRSIEGLFAGIAAGQFLTTRRRMDRGRASKMDMLMKLPGMDQKTTNSIMDGISTHLGDLFEKPFTYAGKEYEAVNFYDMYSPAERAENMDNFFALYFKGLASMRVELQNVIESPEFTEEQKNGAMQVQEYLSSAENRKLVLRMHLNRMETLGFSVQEDMERDENDVVSRDWVDDMDALEVSATKSAPAILKLMLSTLRDNNSVSEIGIKRTYQLGKLLPQLQNLLAGTITLRQQVGKLNSVKDEPGFEWAQQVIDMFDRQLAGLSYEQALPVFRFRGHMAQSMVGAESSKITQSGEIYTIDPAKENVYNTIRRTWLTDLRAMATTAGYVKQDGQRVVFDLDTEFTYNYAQGGSRKLKFDGLTSIVNELRRVQDPIPELLNILKLLGVRFSNENAVIESLETSEYNEASLRSDILGMIGDIVKNGTGAPANIYEREYSTAVSRMNNLIRLEEKTGNRDVELMFLNSEGNMESSVVRYHYMSTVASMSYEELEEYYEPKEYPFGIGSLALDAWKEGGKFEIRNISGLAADVLGESGSKITGLNETDLNVLFIQSILNDTYINLRAADQSTEFGVRFPFEIPGTFDRAIELGMKYLYSELASSAKNIDDLMYVKNYSDNIKELRIMKAFVDPKTHEELKAKLADPSFRQSVVDEIRSSENGESQTLQDLINEKESVLKDSMYKRFEEDLDNYKKFLVSSKNLSEPDGAGFRYFYGMDAKFISNRTGKQGEVSQLVSEQDVNDLLQEVLAKHFIAKNELYRVFYNDPALYSDMFKRLKGTVGTKIISTNEPELLEWLGSDGRLYPKVVREGKVDVLHVQEPVYRIEDELLELYRETYGEGSDVYRAYSEGIKYADGLILIDLPFARLIGATTSQWSPAQERTYNALVEQVDPSIPIDIEEGGTITQAKTHYFGPAKVYKEDGGKANGMAFLKMSMSPIYEQLAYINGKKYPNILEILDFMKRNEAHAMVLPSAIKVGGPNENAQTGFLSPEKQYSVLEGKEKTLYRMKFPDQLEMQASKMELDLRFLGTQLEISPFFKGKTTRTVQATVHTFANLYDEGAPVLEDETDRTVLAYNKTIRTLVEKAFEEMLADNDIQRTVVDGREGYRLSPSSYRKILEKLEEEVTSMQAGMGLLGGIQYLKEKGGEYKLDYFVDKHRIETMMYSALGKQVIRQFMTGEMSVQDSMLGFEIEELGEKIEDASLRFYQKEGKWTAQVMLPHWFKELYKGEKEIRIDALGDMYVDGERMPVDKELLEVIGIRVPTDGTHSIEILEVAGFLPRHMGARIIVPPGIVTKAGSDFDIDKLTLYYMNYVKKGNSFRTLPFYYKLESWFISEKNSVAKMVSDLNDSMQLLENLTEIDSKYDVFEDVLTTILGTMESSWVKEQLSDRDAKALFEDVQGPVYGLSEDATYDQKMEALQNFYDEQEAAVIMKDADPRLRSVEGMSLPRTYRAKVDEGKFDDLLNSVKKKIDVLNSSLEKRLRTEYTFEQWQTNNPDADVFKLQSKKALQNEYIRLKKQLLSLQDRALRETFLKPVGTPNMDALAKEIEDLFKESGRSATPPVNLKEVKDYHLATLPDNLSKVTYSYMQSKKDVGIYALGSTHTVKGQKAGMMFNMNTEYDIPVKRGKPGRTTFAGIHFDHPRFKKQKDDGGRYLDGNISMSSIKNVNDGIITESLSERVNAAVDGVNNPILHILNFPPALAPADIALQRMGVPDDEIVYFMNQPIVRDFISLQETNNGAMTKALSELYPNFKLYDADIIYQLEKKYNTEADSGSTEKVYFSGEMLRDMVAKLPEELTPEQRSHQLQILTDLIVYMQIGDDQTAVINAQSFDTKLPKSRAEMRLTMAMYNEVLSRGVFPNVERVTEDDEMYLSAMKEYNAIADDVFTELFVAEDGTLPFKEVFRRYMERDTMGLQNDFKFSYSRLLASLSHPNNRMAKDKKVRVLQRFEQFFITTLVQNITGPIGKIANDAERLMFGTDKRPSMAQTLASIQTDTSHPLHSNRFINAFLPVVQEERGDRTKNDHIEPKFKALNLYEDAAIVDDFEALRAYDAKNNTSYAADLWKTAILQAGVMNTPFSFLERLSGEMTAELMQKMYESYSETEAQLRDPNNANLPSGQLLLELFGQNMINDPDIVPFVKGSSKGPRPSERLESYALFLKTYAPGVQSQVSKGIGEAKVKKEYDLWMANDSSSGYDIYSKKKKATFVKKDGKLLSSRTYTQGFMGAVKESPSPENPKSEC